MKEQEDVAGKVLHARQKKEKDQEFIMNYKQKWGKIPEVRGKRWIKQKNLRGRIISASRQHQQARGCYKATGETRRFPAVNMSRRRAVNELFLRKRRK